RFAIMDAEFRFGSGGENRFSSIGAGRTFPLQRAGQPSLSIAGVGGILEGSNRFQGRPGVYVMSGIFTPPHDFRLNILIRMNDSAGDLLTDFTLPPVEPMADPSFELTYLYVRTAAQPETAKVTFPGGPPDPAAGGGFPLFYIETSEQITHFHTDFAAEGAQRLRSTRRTGPVIGQHTVTLTSYPAVGGTAASPIPFEDVENFIFTDSRGSTIGSVKAP